MNFFHTNHAEKYIDALAEALRKDLEIYTTTNIRDFLGVDAYEALSRVQRVPALRVCRAVSAPTAVEQNEDQRLAVIIRLVLLGDCVVATEAAGAFASVWADPQLRACMFSQQRANENSAEDSPLCEAESADCVGGTETHYARNADAPRADNISARSGNAMVCANFSIEAVGMDENWPHIAERLADSHVEDPANMLPFTPRLRAEEETLLVASDFGELACRIPREDHVMPVGGASRTLAQIIRYGRGAVLDIGTGCGIHALCAALAGRDVVATDISPRALRYARLNAALAGVSIDFREGSLCEPVTECFTTIISNPPFVITPQKVRDTVNFEYRDGGREGDSLIAELVGELPRHLAKDGRAYLLFNAEIHGSQWDMGPRKWAELAGLDAWIVGRDDIGPSRYAEMWLRDGGFTPRDKGYEETYATWLEDFEARGVVGVSMGYLILGHPEEAGILDHPEKTGIPCHPEGARSASFAEIEPPSQKPTIHSRMFRGPLQSGVRDYFERCWTSRRLSQRGDTELGGKKLQRIGVVEHRYFEPGNDSPLQLLLTQTQGMEHSVPVGTATAAVVGACDGQLDVNTLCRAVAQLLDENPQSVLDEVLPALRELIDIGMLVDADEVA